MVVVLIGEDLLTVPLATNINNILICQNKWGTVLKQFLIFMYDSWHITGYKNFSFYTEPELLVSVIPSGNVEADEAGQEGDDFMAGDFWEADKLV